MTDLLNKFWDWYNKNYQTNLTIATVLFLWQLIHLIWLTTHVVFLRLFGQSFLDLNQIYEYLIIVVDYTEIPAIILTSLIYINILRKGFNWKNLILLVFLNSQWLHLFWITDEFVVEEFVERGGSVLPSWLAWFAILIDYLELPVMYDTTKKLLNIVNNPAKKNT